MSEASESRVRRYYSPVILLVDEVSNTAYGTLLSPTVALFNAIVDIDKCSKQVVSSLRRNTEAGNDFGFAYRH